MAKSKNNVITHGLSGRIGDLIVFRQRAGKTVVAMLPKTTSNASDTQKEHRRRFQQATFYAKAAIADPDTKAAYADSAKTGQTAYNVAVADFFHAPDIESVDLSQYTGQPGDTILIRATDDFMVKEVKVTITNADGSLVEKGDAAPDVGGYLWTYTATQVNDNLEGDKIEIAASDLPGNITREEQSI